MDNEYFTLVLFLFFWIKRTKKVAPGNSSAILPCAALYEIS